LNRITQHMHNLCIRAYNAAETFNINITVVAVDLGGHPVALLRGDFASYPTIESARKKAVTSASLQMSTSALVSMFAADPLVTTALTASGEMLIVPGGFPIYFENRCVGGLGIAGGHYMEDDLIGQKAMSLHKADEAVTLYRPEQAVSQ